MHFQWKWVLIWPFCFMACASTAENARGAHRVLNTVTDIVDPAYAGVVAACDAAEVYVNARHDTPEQEDADIANIHAECNRVLAAFEAARQAQLVARQVAQAAENGTASSEDLWRAVEGLKEAYAAIRGLVEGGWTPMPRSHE